MPVLDFDWTFPVDFANGILYQRIQVMERSGLEAFEANQMLQEDPSGDHLWPSQATIFDRGVYKTEHDVQSMTDPTGRLPCAAPTRAASSAICMN